MYQEFAQEVENTARAVVNDIHTALPGKITSFDPQKGVAVVQPKGKLLTAEGASLEYPMISDVPVAFPYCQSSDVGMAFPVKRGDNCLIIVSEVELDEWRSGAESEAPLRYDLTSAMVIPDLMLGGAAPIQEAIENDAVVIVSKSAKIVVRDGKIDVTGDVTVKGNILVTGDIEIGNADGSSARKTVTIRGGMEVTGNAEIRGNQDVSGDSAVSGSQTVSQNLLVVGDSVTNGNHTVNGSVNVDGNSAVSGNHTVNGTLKAGGININAHRHGGVKAGNDRTEEPQ